MNTLAKPQFSNLPHGESAGAPILLDLWNRFDVSFLLAQSGIIKSSGTPTWMLSFLYVIGLVARCASVSKMAGMAAQDTLLKIMFQGKNLTQYTLSRFLTSNYKRVQRLQEDPDTKLQEGDVVALDDSLVVHPYGKQLPFLCWLFDHSLKVNVWGMNLVALHSILRNGLE